MLDLSKKTNLFLLTAGIGCGLALVTFLWPEKKKREWLLVGHVEKLYLYPLKSGAPVESDVLYFDSMGPKKELMIDRGFAVANEEIYTIRHQHAFPKLCLISLSLEIKDGSKRVTLRETNSEEECVFDLPNDFSQEPKERFVSTEFIKAPISSVFDCGDIPAAWLTQILKKEEKGLRLIYHYKDTTVRTHSPYYTKKFGDTMGSSHLPALSNASPYHMVTTSSVDELNRQLGDEKTTPLNFRPNMVVKTVTNIPYQEDQWDQVIKIGSMTELDDGVELEYSMPDPRCPTVNVDQSTGEKDKSEKLLKWIKKNRRILGWWKSWKMGGAYGAGIFGHRYGLKEGSQGDVKVGQEIWALV